MSDFKTRPMTPGEAYVRLKGASGPPHDTTGPDEYFAFDDRFIPEILVLIEDGWTIDRVDDYIRIVRQPDHPLRNRMDDEKMDRLLRRVVRGDITDIAEVRLEAGPILLSEGKVTINDVRRGLGLGPIPIPKHRHPEVRPMTLHVTVNGWDGDATSIADEVCTRVVTMLASLS